jgi:hypothetical protein
MRRGVLLSLLVCGLAGAHHKVVPDDGGDGILTPGWVGKSAPNAPATRLPRDVEDDDVLPPSSKVVGTVANAAQRPATAGDSDDVLPPGTVHVGKIAHPQNDDDVLEPGASKSNGHMVFQVDLTDDDDVLPPGQIKAGKPASHTDEDDPGIRTYRTRADDDDVLPPTFKTPPPSSVKLIEP